MSDRQSENDAVFPSSDLPVAGRAADGDTAEPLYDLVEVAPAAASAPPVATPQPLGEAPVEPQAGTAPAGDAKNDAVVAAPSAPSPQTIYVSSPDAPAKKGNRAFGVLIAVVSGVIFAAMFALALAIILSADGSGLRFDFLASDAFYVPVIFFVVGFLVLVAIANRAGWWAYVLGSIFVMVLVYVGTVAAGLVIAGVFLETAAGAARLFTIALSNPFVIAAALIAREVSMWMGCVIAARGRRVTARNTESRASFDRDSAERRAQYGRTGNGPLQPTI